MPSPLVDDEDVVVEAFDDLEAVKPGGEPGASSAITFISLQIALVAGESVNDLCRK